MMDTIKPEWVERIQANQAQAIERRRLTGKIVIYMGDRAKEAGLGQRSGECPHAEFDGVSEKCFGCGRQLVELFGRVDPQSVHAFRTMVLHLSSKIK